MPKTLTQPDPGVQAKHILQHLAGLQKAYLLYPADHSQPRQIWEKLRSILHSFFEWNSMLSYDFFEQIFIFQERPFIEESLHCGAFSKDCSKHNLGNIAIFPGISAADVQAFLSLLSKKPEELEDAGGLAAALRAKNISSIVIAEASIVAEDFSKDKKGQKQRAKRIYQRIESAFEDIQEQLRGGGDVNLNLAKQNVNSLLAEVLENQQAILALAAIKKHDSLTSHHSINVCILSLLVGSKIFKKYSELNVLGAAALLHDIGKINLPKKLITKVSPLTPEEWEAIKKHPVFGANILKGLDGIDKLAMVVAYEHHAGLNLKGYPEIKDKSAPHVFSRIVHIADVYEASTSSLRPYSAHPLAPDVILGQMYEKRDSYFDSQILKVFIKTLGIYPIGTLVVLNTGERGIVSENQDKDLLRPVVKVFTDAAGNQCPPHKLDLSSPNNCRVSIVESRTQDSISMKPKDLFNLATD